MKGVWHGRGAEMLQLSGEVKQEDFFRLCDNLNPATGEQLTPRNKDERRVMTDLTFDVPKSVTLAYELGGDDRILDAFRKSLRETMSEIERNVQTRVRKNGADTNRPSGNLIWAEHIHRTARPVTKDEGQTVDPQLHAHATVFNATFDSVEKRWKAIQLGDIVRDKGNYQAAFHARLAHRLKGLGYGIEKVGNSFKVSGIDRATVEKFSQRHGVINKEAERLGALDPESKAKIARRSREKKNPEPQSMEDLQKEWDSRLMPEERLAIKTAAMGLEKGRRNNNAGAGERICA
jgi:conjugative relaxase-like TrwC/TraI family protein